MITDTVLIEKREELKRRLAAGEYKTLVDVFLAWINRAIQKITRQTKPLPLWLMTILLSIFTDLIFFGAIYIAGDFIVMRKVVLSYGLGYGWGIISMIFVTVLTNANLIIINQSIGRIFVLWHDNILNATESISSLQKFEDWLEKVCNWRQHFIAAILGGLLLTIVIVALLNITLGVLAGYGFTFGIAIANILSAVFLYQFAMVILLPMMLRNYDLKLFAADPATSELLSHLSGELGFFIYIIAFYSAIITLGSFTGESYQSASVGIVLVLVFWLPIIIMFVANQTSLSSLVRRAKWKTLNEIQAKVEKLQASENFEAKETMDAINRLLDYHERVNKTRISALDFRAYLNFINSLLLPLLAFLLGNLDKVLSLFSTKP